MTTLIIGGGWSGLAAAVTLVQQGHSVHLVESAKQLGGRARNVQWQNQTVDNGQHLMIGAYDRMLAMIKLIGIDSSNVFQRRPLDITIHDPDFPPLNLSTKGYLPWPLSLAWNLIRSTGLSGLLQVARLQSDIPTLLANKDITVSEWLLAKKQSNRLIKQLWEPLCLATLNTPIDHASAHVLARVLLDSLGGTEASADLLIPKQTLGNLFPRVAADYIKQHGGEIDLQTRATKIIIRENKVQSVILDNDHEIYTDNVIVATNPSQSIKLLSPHIKISKPVEYPICTIYLQYSADTHLPSAMMGMSGTLSQWIFDRSEQSPGLMAVVISGPGVHEKMPKNELIERVCEEVHHLLPTLPVTVEDSLLICEKRATFACTVDIESNRPQSKTDIDGLWLAGDFIANSYPATLEGAIRNGENCARLLL